MIGSYTGDKVGDTRTIYVCPKCGTDWRMCGSEASGLCRICGNDPRHSPTLKTIQRLEKDGTWSYVP